MARQAGHKCALPRICEIDQLTALRFLTTQAGQALLDAAEAHPGPVSKTVLDLRRHCSQDEVAAAVNQAELRRRAADRFSKAHSMLFTRDGLEQATAEAVSVRRAAMFPSGGHVLDLCCGIGADAMHLVGRGATTLVDLDPAALLCADWNCRLMEGAAEVASRLEDVRHTDLRCSAAFLDPARRREGRKVTQPDQYSPPVSWIEQLHRQVPNLCVKLAPGTPHEAIAPFDCRVEFVSLHGVLREAALWFGEIGPSARLSAVVLPSGAVMTSDDAGPAGIAAPRAFLVEPDPAVIQAHLLGTLAEQLEASRLDTATAYLTTDAWSGSPFARAWPIMEVMPLHLDRVARRLKAMGAYAAVVKQRGASVTVEAAHRALPKRGHIPITVVLTPVEGRQAAVLCGPISAPV